MTRKILIAVDGSATSNEMLGWASKNFLLPTDKVLLVHVHQRPSDMYALDPSLVTVNEEAKAAMKKAGAKLLEASAKTLSSLGVHDIQTFLRGDSKEDIVNVAKEEGADTLLIGSRGLGMVQRAFLGSTSDFCVHHCHCPVLVYKSQAAQ